VKVKISRGWERDGCTIFRCRASEKMDGPTDGKSSM